MVDKPIPLLPDAVLPLVGDELFEVIQNGNSRKAPVSSVTFGEAPLDGNIYGRQSATWMKTISEATFLSNKAVTDGAIFTLQTDLDALEVVVATKAPLISPALTGNPTTPTPPPGDNDTSIANTSFVTTAVANEATARANADALKANINSPVFTGDPQAPTPVASDNDTSIATTAFVKAQGYLPASGYTPADILAKLLTVDGVGSGLDADLLDGQHGAYYLDLGLHTGNLDCGTY